MSSIAEVRGISVRFGVACALSKVSMALEEGEFLVVVGPSGCGKTTLLRVMSGFETPTEGTVHLGGEDVTLLPPHRRDVNQVFQSYALFPHLSVVENVGFGLRMRGVSRKESAARVEEALALVSLSGKEHRRPESLSGGEKQRVALARALVCRPRLLLLDEPLAALDAELRTRVRSELRALQRRLGMTFVMVTHDQDEALGMGDRVAIMRGGRIEQLGPSREVYERPRTRFVASFLGAANVLSQDQAVGLGLSAEGTVAVRREHVHLGDGPLEGRVLTVTYGGSSAEVLIETRGQRLSVLVPGGDAPGPGTRVALRISHKVSVADE